MGGAVGCQGWVKVTVKALSSDVTLIERTRNHSRLSFRKKKLACVNPDKRCGLGRFYRSSSGIIGPSPFFTPRRIGRGDFDREFLTLQPWTVQSDPQSSIAQDNILKRAANLSASIRLAGASRSGRSAQLPQKRRHVVVVGDLRYFAVLEVENRSSA